MPELPEVEVTRRGIAERLRGAQIVSVRLGKPLRWPLGVDPGTLVGAVAGEPLRRGKYLWLPLGRAAAPSSPGSAGGLLVHLGMSGALSWHEHAPPPGPHAHFDLGTTRGTLRLTDPRRFGAVLWSPGLDAPPAAELIGRLGAEPFDPTLTAATLRAALRRRTGPIKPLLLGGQVIVGAGNIYASEALFHAGIHPAAAARRLGGTRCERLLVALRATLGRAVELGGSTLRDFHGADGVAGGFQDETWVYGRAGQPCRRCGTPVRRIVQAQRATYYCPACQRR